MRKAMGSRGGAPSSFAAAALTSCALRGAAELVEWCVRRAEGAFEARPNFIPCSFSVPGGHSTNGEGTERGGRRGEVVMSTPLLSVKVKV